MIYENFKYGIVTKFDRITGDEVEKIFYVVRTEVVKVGVSLIMKIHYRSPRGHKRVEEVNLGEYGIRINFIGDAYISI